MTRAEARDELAKRWNAATLMAAAAGEYMHVRDWLPPITRPAAELLEALERGTEQRNNDGGKAA